ncbi:MAG TPA: 8-amino-7-oxononanoate synthase [bacterium]|nr:8-amino-7-oxononanoate synthase [bacterium]
MKQFRADIKKQLEDLEKASSLRTIKTIEKRIGNQIWIEGVRYLNCSSNDYLGIAGDIELKKEFLNFCAINTELLSTDLSSSSSRLLTGSSSIYDETERQIAQFYGKEDCIIFSSGYHMNAGFFAAMYEKGDLIIADKLVHASIIDGMKLSRAEHIRYNHLDYSHLRKILSTNRTKYRHTVIVTESVFSMDGDIADLNELTEIAEYFDAQLFVDEAHAVGCCGEKGQGICEKTATTQKIDFIAGTFGKALGGIGAFIVCDRSVKQYLINRCRSFIFTTALPPLNISWISFVLKRIPGMKDHREKLARISDLFRHELIKSGFDTKGSSHIVPVITGDDEKTVTISEKMKVSGFYVPAIRPPTVPAGTSRLRFSLTAEFSEDDVNRIVKTLSQALR